MSREPAPRRAPGAASSLRSPTAAGSSPHSTAAGIGSARSPRKWHATSWLSPALWSVGTAVAQMAGWPSSARSGQRGWKRHPLGGLTGLGTSPLRMIRRRMAPGSGRGIADMSATVNRGAAAHLPRGGRRPPPRPPPPSTRRRFVAGGGVAVPTVRSPGAYLLERGKMPPSASRLAQRRVQMATRPLIPRGGRRSVKDLGTRLATLIAGRRVGARLGGRPVVGEPPRLGPAWRAGCEVDTME